MEPDLSPTFDAPAWSASADRVGKRAPKKGVGRGRVADSVGFYEAVDGLLMKKPADFEAFEERPRQGC